MKLTEVKYAGMNLQNAWFVVDMDEPDLIIGPFPSRSDARRFVQRAKYDFKERNLELTWTTITSPERFYEMLNS